MLVPWYRHSAYFITLSLPLVLEIASYPFVAGPPASGASSIITHHSFLHFLPAGHETPPASIGCTYRFPVESRPNILLPRPILPSHVGQWMSILVQDFEIIAGMVGPLNYQHTRAQRSASPRPMTVHLWSTNPYFNPDRSYTSRTFYTDTSRSCTLNLPVCFSIITMRILPLINCLIYTSLRVTLFQFRTVSYGMLDSVYTPPTSPFQFFSWILFWSFAFSGVSP